jgi:hypothetical protein
MAICLVDLRLLVSMAAWDLETQVTTILVMTRFEVSCFLLFRACVMPF